MYAYLLSDVHVRRAGTTNANTDMIIGEILLGQLSHVLVESGREQEITMITVLVGVTTRHDLRHLFIPVIVKHLVGFVNDGVSENVSP